MKNFIKTLPKRHPLSVEIRELYGAEAFTYLTDLLDLVQEIGDFELTPQIVARECGLKAQKVQRIFQDLKRIFEESCKILGLSLKNPSESLKNPSESLKNPSRSTPSNPHGSTRDQEEKRGEEKREEKNTKKNSRSVGTSPRQAAMWPEEATADSEFECWWQAYPQKVGKGQARKAYWVARKKVPAVTLLEGIASYRVGKPHYADWKHPTTWLNGECWGDDYQTGLASASDSQSTAKPQQLTRIDKLLAAPKIRNRFSGEVVERSRLTIDSFKQLYLDGSRFEENEFDPVMEDTA